MTKTATPIDSLNEINLSPRELDAILVHKYFMGIDADRRGIPNYDPILPEAMKSFFLYVAKRYQQQMYHEDAVENIDAIKSKLKKLTEKGIVAKLIRRGKDHTEITNMIGNHLIRNGWAKKNTELKNCLGINGFECFSVEPDQTVKSLKNIVNDCYCDVFMEVNHGGDFTINGKQYLDVKKRNYRTDHTQMNFLLYGKEAMKARTKLEQALVLQPEPVLIPEGVPAYSG